MGLMNALVAGIGGAAQAGAQHYMGVARSEEEARIALDKAKALDSWNWEQKKARASEDLAMEVAKEEELGAARAKTAGLATQAQMDAKFDPKNIAAEIARMDKMSAAEAKVAADRVIAELNAKSTPTALAAQRAIAQATKDPQTAALQALQVKAAQLTYDRAVEEAKIPKAVERSFASLQESKKIIETAIAKSSADGTYDPASKAGAEQVAKYNEITKQMTSLMTPYMPKELVTTTTGGTKSQPSLAQAHAAAWEDVDSGRLTVDQANAKLKQVGFAPIAAQKGGLMGGAPTNIEYPETPLEKWRREGQERVAEKIRTATPK